MSKPNVWISFLLSFLYSSIIYSQNPQVSISDSIDFEVERAQIPGETMGQKMESLLFWTEAEKKRRFPHMHQIYPSIEITSGKEIYPLDKGNSLLPELSTNNFLSSYMEKNNIGGLLVLKDNKIRLEMYGEGIDSNTKWTSFSVAKSVTSMLLGVALKEGDVESLEDPLAKYIPELKGTDYGQVTVQELLTMTSGIEWNEDYADANSDVAQMYLKPCFKNEPHILTYMKTLKSTGNSGENFNYSTGETDLLGILIQKATQRSMADYLSEKIWKPWGMEHRAFWLADECSMLNLGGSGISASLRDYGRIGTLMLHDNNQENEFFDQVWFENATSLVIPVGNEGSGYGYLWWRFADGSYAAFGIFGQMIYINPNTQTVIAQFAAWPQAGSKALSEERADLINRIEKALE